MNLTRNREVAGLIPWLAQRVKDLALPLAVVWVTNTAHIPRCCGCGVGHQLLTLGWEPPYAVGEGPKKT